MVKGSVFTSIVTKEDFEENMRGVVYIEDTPNIGEWTYDSPTRSAHIVTNNTQESFIQIKLGYLYVGDTIDISADLLSVSGQAPRIILDRYTDETYSVKEVEEGYVSSDVSSFKNTSLKFSVSKDGAYFLRIGLLYSQTGEFKMRNIAIDAKTISSNLGSDMRRAVINFTSKGNPIIDKRFSNDIASLSVVDAGLSLMVAFEPPFRNNGKLIGFVSNEWFSNSKNYIPRLSSAENHSAQIRIFSMDTNEPVPISEVSGGVFVPVLLLNAKK